MSMINQKQVLSLQQKLSPQQIQMIKLLELPTMQLEQRIKQGSRRTSCWRKTIIFEDEQLAADFGGGIPPGRRNSFL